MALVLQLPHDLEQMLQEQAKAQGLSLAEYVQRLLEKQAILHAHVPKLSPEEFEANLDALTQFADKIPDLPDETFNRESIYRDHD